MSLLCVFIGVCRLANDELRAQCERSPAFDAECYALMKALMAIEPAARPTAAEALARIADVG